MRHQPPDVGMMISLGLLPFKPQNPTSSGKTGCNSQMWRISADCPGPRRWLRLRHGEVKGPLADERCTGRRSRQASRDKQRISGETPLKLIGRSLSPFVRRTAVTLNAYGIPFENVQIGSDDPKV